MPTLSLTIVEIIVLMLGAIVLGITIHFFIVSRRNLRSAVPLTPKTNKAAEEWKNRYNSDLEIKEKEIAALRKSLEEEKENSNIFSIEAEEQQLKNKKLKEELAAAKLIQPVGDTIKPDFTDQLRDAQKSLTDQNEKLGLLLGKIEKLKGSAEKQDDIKQENEELSNRVMELETRLLEKEKEISNIRQKAHLTKEMSSMLDNAYNEFQVLQSKIEKLELQASGSKINSVELANIKEENLKNSRDLEESRQKLQIALTENQQLKTKAVTLEDDLKEAGFLQQQLEKKVAYLEELNNDLQAVSDTNKKLEGQIKRIGELESMLNMLAEERDQLMRRQKKAD